MTLTPKNILLNMYFLINLRTHARKVKQCALYCRYLIGNLGFGSDLFELLVCVISGLKHFQNEHNLVVNEYFLRTNYKFLTIKSKKADIMLTCGIHLYEISWR